MAAPRVFGYVRVGSRHKARVERWRQRIADYCRQEGLALELVFADRGVNGGELVRPGWTALLDVLNPKDAQMVVIPADNHLSPDQVFQADMRAQLAAAGAMALVMPARARAVVVESNTEGRSWING